MTSSIHAMLVVLVRYVSDAIARQWVTLSGTWPHLAVFSGHGHDDENRKRTGRGRASALVCVLIYVRSRVEESRIGYGTKGFDGVQRSSSFVRSRHNERA